MRVGIIALLQESNTFIANKTTLERFEEELLLRGEAVRERLSTAQHETGGFFEGLIKAGIDAAPIFAARAMPFGVITAETFNKLLAMMSDELNKAGRLDGLLVALHGATVSELEPDADGYTLELLRRRMGPDLPIIITIDPHANLSQRMVENCNALTAYRTNPHVDQRERGLEAAGLMARTLRGEIKPTQAAEFPPMAINIERQLTSDEPCRGLIEAAKLMRDLPGVLSDSIVLGFPYADVAEMGSSVVVVTDNDPALARRLARQLATEMWNRRESFTGQFIGIEEALDRASQLPGPTCLLDMGDNAGGGSPGDGTYLALAIHKRKLGKSFVCIFDPQAVQEAEKAGAGANVQLAVGGKLDGMHGKPLSATFEVVSLHDGQFEELKPRHGGVQRYDQGRTAIVRTKDGLTVMLTSRRAMPWSLVQLTSCGLDPAGFQIIVAKGVHAPIAAYREVCRNFVRVNTPGVTCADLKQFDFHHRRKPMFPWEPDIVWPAGIKY